MSARKEFPVLTAQTKQHLILTTQRVPNYEKFKYH